MSDLEDEETISPEQKEFEDKVDEAKRFLMKESQAGGPTLHDHLVQVMLKLITERPDDANAQFENISLALRQVPAADLLAASAAKAAKAAPAKEGEEEDSVVAAEAAAAAKINAAADAFKAKMAEWCAGHAYLFPKPPPPEPEEGEDEEAEEAFEDPQISGQVSNLLDDAHLYALAGVGFGEEQTLRLFRSMQILAGREGDECMVRFWGKVGGRAGDYFVVYANTETTGNPDPLEEDEETGLKRGFQLGTMKDFDAEGVEGTNKYTYWVTTEPNGDRTCWTKLPHVTPAQIQVARHHRRYFTGDLRRNVATFPPLPGGTEAHLLRATIAEITADCHLSLAGALVEADDDAAAEDPPVIKVRPLEEDEDTMKHFSVAEMKLPENWIHAEVPIRPNGRCQMRPPPEDEEAEEVPLEEKQKGFFAPMGLKDEAPDKDLTSLKPACGAVSEDLDANGKPEWVVRVCGVPACAGQTATCMAKSLKWPGAVAIASGFQAPNAPTEKPRRRVANVYVGLGVPRKPGGGRHTPKQPAPVGVEQPVPPDEQPDILVEPPPEEED